MRTTAVSAYLCFVMVLGLAFSGTQGTLTPTPAHPARSLGRAQAPTTKIPAPVDELSKSRHPLVRTAAATVSRMQPLQPSDGTIRVTATGYCSCAACCGKSNGITASGTSASWGTIAAPRGWTFGSSFSIVELDGIFMVRDRGGAISGNRIDIWFPTHEQALAWGRRTVTLVPIN